MMKRKAQYQIEDLSNVRFFDKETGEDVLKVDTAKLQTSFSIREFTPPKAHRFDMSKVKTLSDILKILDALDIYIYDTHHKFEQVKQYLVEED